MGGSLAERSKLGLSKRSERYGRQRGASWSACIELAKGHPAPCRVFLVCPKPAGTASRPHRRLDPTRAFALADYQRVPTGAWAQQPERGRRGAGPAPTQESLRSVRGPTRGQSRRDRVGVPKAREGIPSRPRGTPGGGVAPACAPKDDRDSGSVRAVKKLNRRGGLARRSPSGVTLRYFPNKSFSH